MSKKRDDLTLQDLDEMKDAFDPRRPDPERNPFPVRTPRGRVIVDETCTCAHKRTEHGPTLAFGHGPCRRAGCACARFTWAGMMYLDDETNDSQKGA